MRVCKTQNAAAVVAGSAFHAGPGGLQSGFFSEAGKQREQDRCQKDEQGNNDAQSLAKCAHLPNCGQVLFGDASSLAIVQESFRPQRSLSG